ncbi:MAG: glycosyltransferase [Rhodobacter sp.]|nr:glycosyltransferase [Rhodobacter sp.]
MRKALVYTVDEREVALALFSARSAALLHPNRDFDIVIASLAPLQVPTELARLGIRNAVVDAAEAMAAERLKLDWLPLVAYLRLWLPSAFADRYDRLVYLDADTCIVAPGLSRLFDVDLGPHVLGAVLDKEQWLAPGEPVLDFAQRGIAVDRYLNSGVLLIDVGRYNGSGSLGAVLDVHRAGRPTLFHDQSLLNLALQGQFAELSPRWNWQWTHRYPALTRPARPFVLHFGGPPKPWHAHAEPTRHPAAIVEAYAEFLTGVGSPLAFQTGRRGGMRAPLYRQLSNLVGHKDVWPRYRRLMRRVPDPFTARL